MADMLDRKRKHLFLERKDSIVNSFIANVNALVDQLEAIIKLNSIFDEDKVRNLLELAKYDISILIEDLQKGTYNGGRKLDIDLLRNYLNYSDDLTDDEKREVWGNPSNIVYYDKAIVEFVDGSTIERRFTRNGIEVSIKDHHALYDQFKEWDEFNDLAKNTSYAIMPHTPIYNHELLRFWEIGEGASNVKDIVLVVSDKGHDLSYDAVYVGAKVNRPVYTWMDTTSTLQVIANSIEELKTLARNLDWLLEVLDKVAAAEGYADSAKKSAEDAEQSAENADKSADRAKECADIACSCAHDSEEFADKSVVAYQGSVNVLAAVQNIYNSLLDYADLLDRINRMENDHALQIAYLTNASIMQTERIDQHETKHSLQVAYLVNASMLQTERINKVEKTLSTITGNTYNITNGTYIIRQGQPVPVSLAEGDLLVVLNDN